MCHAQHPDPSRSSSHLKAKVNIDLPVLNCFHHSSDFEITCSRDFENACQKMFTIMERRIMRNTRTPIFKVNVTLNTEFF
jgi:hypothetical protein